jgi:hypothetical protein
VSCVQTTHDLTPRRVPIAELIYHPQNVRDHDLPKLRASLRAHGQFASVVRQASTGYVIKGNGTMEAAAAEGWDALDVVTLDVDDDQALRILLIDNATSDGASNRVDGLADLLASLDGDLTGTGYTGDDLAALMASLAPEPEAPVFDSTPLAERFLIPPFSVFDTRQGYWQARKDRWIELGLTSGEGRAIALAYRTTAPGDFGRKMVRGGRQSAGQNGTSLFDPVLCEILLAWYSRPGARVLDPFAGGSVRGVVSSMMGRSYVGVDLSAEQVEANRAQAATICAGPTIAGEPCPPPEWHVGDSRDVTALWPPAPGPFDMILTCPPYHDLEVYSDDPRDLSNAPGADGFHEALAVVLTAAAARLSDDRFAAVVMGEARGRRGELSGLIPATIAAARQAGLTYHNEIVLLNPVGSSAVRAGRPFEATRKVTRTHQTVLVFVKGDPGRAVDWCGPVTEVLTDDTSSDGTEKKPA